MSGESTEEEDRADMADLAGGHDIALSRLMDRHSERLFHYLVRQMRDETEAEDLAQETFVRVYQNRTKFKLNERFAPWLYAIATNLARDRQRWLARHPQLSLESENEQTGNDFRETLPASQPNPSQTLQLQERAALVRQAIADLPDELRTALILADYEDCSQAEIAAIQHCSIKAVEMRLYRARQQLREQLKTLLQPV